MGLWPLKGREWNCYSQFQHTIIHSNDLTSKLERESRERWGAEWRQTRTVGSRTGLLTGRISSTTSGGPVATLPSSESSASPSPSSSTKASSKNFTCKMRMQGGLPGSSGSHDAVCSYLYKCRRNFQDS